MKRLFIDGTGGKKWIGGLYYKKNVIFSLLKNPAISSNVHIIVATEEENKNVFSTFGKTIEIRIIKYSTEKERKIKLLLLAVWTRSEYVFPSFGRVFRYFNIEDINWIADFQHNRLPNFFPDDEVAIRNNAYREIAEKKTPLVLSSFDSLNDFKTFYVSDRTNLFVVPFVSYIEPEIRDLSEKNINDILNKFGLLNKSYACIMNQFWKHKNHIVVFKAIQEYLSRNPNSSFIFAFTGKLEDYRNPLYIESLKKVMQNPIVDKHIKILDFIERKEQIAIMKKAEYVIQPSLFEGWGTVLEDAKVLDKWVLLSDIPVHQEQKSEKCILFDPHDSHKLSLILEEECKKIHISNIEFGIRNMHDRALLYSKNFEQILLER